MTKAQERAIKLIENKAKQFLFCSENWEFKEFDATDMGHFVSLTFEVGMKGDEGTLAEFMCRDRGHVWIGKRGAITYPVDSKRAKYGFTTKKFTGITKVVMEQKIRG